MDNFDQLLKEKIEQKQYSYKASAWRNFARNSGVISPVSTVKVLAISIASASVLSVAGYYTFKQISQPTQPAEVTIAVCDTVMENPVVIEDDTAIIETSFEEPAIESAPVAQVSKSKRRTEENSTTDEVLKPAAKEEPQATKKVITRDNHSYWRVSIINPDTIGPEE